MPLQGSGTITIQQIATEFGGSTPHNLSEYYRGGGLVPNTPANSAIPTSGQISLSQFYNSSAVSGAIVNPLTPVGGTYSAADAEAFISATCTLTVNTDGTTAIASATSGSAASGSWYSPTTAGIGNTHWVRFTVTANSASGTGGTVSFTPSTGWLQLNIARQVSVLALSAGTGRTQSATYTVEISTSNTGSPIVSTRTGITLTATDSA